MDEIHRITAAPRLELVEAPVPSAASAAAIAAARAELLARPGGFDEDVLMVAEATPGRIAVFATRYSWARGIWAGATDLGLGILGVSLWLEQDGEVIWQLRAPGVAAGGTWDLAAGGAVGPGQGLEDAARREAHEELGIAAGDLGDLAPRLLLTCPGHGALVIFSAELPPGARLAPDPAEVGAIGRTRGEAPGTFCVGRELIAATMRAHPALSAG